MTQAKSKSRILLAILPLLAFAVLAGVFWKMLSSDRDPSKLPSALIGKAAPDIELQPLAGVESNGAAVPGIPLNGFSGKVSVVNFWASWCQPCRVEHPLILELAQNDEIQIIGINYKDKSDRAKKFITELGNPYDRIGVDTDGRAAIEWGVYGMPETFLVDQSGTIVFKHTGPLTPDILQNGMLPVIARQF